MDLSLQSIKTNHWSVDNLKNMSPQWVTLVSGYPFWQLSIDHNMDVHKDVHYQNCKLNTDCIYLAWTPS